MGTTGLSSTLRHGGWGPVDQRWPGSWSQAARRERITSPGAGNDLLTKMLRPLITAPRLKTEQRTEDPAMGNTGLDGWADELKVRARDRVCTPITDWAGNTLRFHGGILPRRQSGASRCETRSMRFARASGQRPREAPLTRRDTMKRKRSVPPHSTSSFCFCFCFSGERARALPNARAEAGQRLAAGQRTGRAGRGKPRVLGVAEARAGSVHARASRGGRGPARERRKARELCAPRLRPCATGRRGGTGRASTRSPAASDARDERSADAPADPPKRGET
jgi:hypothetical protein